jgi:TonB family protein
VSYAVSAFHERSDHMSPVAALLAGLLHAATALAVFWVSPLNQRDIEVPTVDVTIEEPKPPEQPPLQEAVKPPIPPPPPPAVQAAPPPPPPAAAAKPEPKPAPTPEPKPQEQITSKVQPGVEPPAPVKPDPPKQETTKPAEATLEPPKPAEPKPQEPKPQPAQEAAATPPPPSAPPQPELPLEKVVPPVETPPAPLTMRDFVKVMPPPVPPPRPQPAPPQPHPPQPLQHSPLSTVPTPQPQTSSSASVSTFVNPAAEAANTSAKNAYLVAVLRKFSQYLPNLRAKNEGGTVVLRFVIARDGRLIDATILKSSGVMALDKGMLDTLRAAAPYPPLPPEITENQVVFVQPIQARQ